MNRSGTPLKTGFGPLLNYEDEAMESFNGLISLDPSLLAVRAFPRGILGFLLDLLLLEVSHLDPVVTEGVLNVLTEAIRVYADSMGPEGRTRRWCVSGSTPSEAGDVFDLVAGE